MTSPLPGGAARHSFPLVMHPNGNFPLSSPRVNLPTQSGLLVGPPPPGTRPFTFPDFDCVHATSASASASHPMPVLAPPLTATLHPRSMNRSCEACYRSKVRCQGHHSADGAKTKCTRCQTRNIPCIFRERKRKEKTPEYVLVVMEEGRPRKQARSERHQDPFWMLSSQQNDQLGLSKLKRSCEECFKSKVRCQPSEFNMVCERCMRRGTPCTFLERKKRESRVDSAVIDMSEN